MLNTSSGVVPDFIFQGVGIRVEAIQINTPAHDADVNIGDIITAINGRKIQNFTDYMKSLDAIKKGEKVSFRIKVKA